MAQFVSPLSFTALLQDVIMNPISARAEANACKIDDATMSPAYYMGLQSTQPAASPAPEGNGPLPLPGKPPTPAGLQQILA